MIDEDSKYFSLSGNIYVGGPSTWHITDWDRRHVVSVTMDDDQEDESLAIEHFSRLNSQLSPDVYRIHVSDAGEIISTYTDPDNDPNHWVHYPLLSEISLPPGIQTVRRDELEELDRLGPDADLVSYPPCSGASATKAVFKYHFLWQYSPRAWKEMNLWMRLPRHPNIAPFDKIVLDELEGRVVGFTNIYVPGGNLEKNKSRVFKLEWLKQLIEVVDLLNLRHGIAHQDIAPRNLAVDDSTDSIKLFDFNYAARIGLKSPLVGHGEDCVESRNDVKGVIFTAYELITGDYKLRDLPHEQQNLDDLAKEWVQHPEVKLDHPVTSYRHMLQEWQELRASNPRTGDAPEAINWPPRPPPPLRDVPVLDANRQPTYMTVENWSERRQNVWKRGGKVLNWERPPQRVLDSGIRVLSTGEILKC